MRFVPCWTPLRLPLSLLLAAAAFVSALIAGIFGCADGPTIPPIGPPDVATVSGGTRVLVVSLSPLVIAFENESGKGALGTADGSCEAFALGVRPRSDDGERYHAAEDPADDIEWFFANDVVAAEANEGAPASSQAFALTFTSDESSRSVEASLTVSPIAEDFVAIDLAFDIADGDVAMVQSCFPLDGESGEPPSDGNAFHVVGGGERFDGVDLYGRTIPLAFRAPGPFASGTNESHAPIPFFATNFGAGVLVETERVGAFDVGQSQPGRLFARFHGTALPLRVRAAPRPSEDVAPRAIADSPIVDNVAAHNRYMGLPPSPPRWALAPQQWRNEHALTIEDDRVVSSGQDRLMDDIAKMRSFDIPGSLVWIDAPWSTGFNDFEFNPEQWPDVDALFRETEDAGYHVIVWATEHINRSDDSSTQFGMPPFATLDLFQRFSEQGYFVKNTDGSPFTLSWGRGTGGYIDFTHAPATEAWQDLLRPVVERGVRGFKLDYGESMRADLLGLGPNDAVVFADGTTTRVQHTRYQRLYHEAFLSVLDEVWGEDRFIITRTGGIYDQRNGVALWPGDLENDFSLGGIEQEDGTLSVGGLRGAISGGLSANMSGYPLYGSDIGGYRGGPPTTEVLIRWAQFGALSPIMQLGGGGTGDQTHNPWDEALYDVEQALPAYTKAARLHMDLVPYIAAHLGRLQAGLPLMVPLGVLTDVDEDWNDHESYLFGNALLVAPVVTEGATTRTVRFPRGAWLAYESGEEFGGQSAAVVEAPLDTLPLFIRAGAVLPLLDPRVDTFLTAEGDADVIDASDVAPLLRVRTSAGPDDAFALADGTTLSQTTDGNQSVVSIAGANTQRYVVTLWVRAEVGPDANASINGIAAGAAEEVTSEAELLECQTPCTFRDAARLAIAVEGDALDVTFGAQ